MKRAVVAAVLAPILGLVTLGQSSPALADDEYRGASVIFARGGSLYRTDPRGRGETEVATLADRSTVRALRTDTAGTVLLADLGGKWWWMPLDGKARTLTELPCADGPAQLATDGACVLCRSTTSSRGSVIVNLATGKQTPIEIPAPGARLVGAGANRRLVWADAGGVWSSPPGDLRKKTRVAPEAPLRSFLPSPDGSRAVGVYLDKVYANVRETRPAELLMNFALDGQAARRKAIKEGVPVEWSSDNQWILLQDRGSACLMSVMGGQYKCWKGYTGASIASDGRWALVLGERTAAKAPAKATPKKGARQPSRAAKKGAKQTTQATQATHASGSPAAEPSNESENREGDDSAPIDDVEVPPPSGPLALYRVKLAGAFNETPVQIVKIVDGAAVWLPATP